MNSFTGRERVALTTALLLACAAPGAAQGAGARGTARITPPRARREVVLARDGTAVMAILSSEVPAENGEHRGLPTAPARELEQYLERITGADFRVAEAAEDATGIYVGLATDFPWLGLAEELDGLGPEGFLIRSDQRGLLLAGKGALGVQHAVTTFLQELGCRWFFPGEVWEVVPEKKAIAGSWNTRQSPSFGIQRRLWYGFGAYRQNKLDKEEWDRHNRMGGPTPISIGHTWHGLDREKDFAAHPEWFALVKGERKASKPCYSHAEVIKRATESALAQAAEGRRMISMTPPDGLGYCECDRCRAVARGGEVYWEKGSQFAKRPDGRVVNVTSETLFNMVNEVAVAVAEKFPDTLIGCYAYSAYSHPPSFRLHPNVFLQTTTAYRRTPMSLEEQLRAFRRLGVRSGIRGYWDVYQWSYDGPELMKWNRKSPGEPPVPSALVPVPMQETLHLYAENGVGSMNAEMSNNWGPRGLGYYVGARLLWNVDEDVDALVADFYEKAFGPAAGAMERYYARWYGPSVAVLHKKNAPPPARFGPEALRDSYRDLDEAARLAKGQPGYRDRVDHLRMYAHYLFLRIRLEEAAATGEKEGIIRAIKEETEFGARLMDTNMIHSRPLIGKAFHRRFRRSQKYLQGMPEGEGKAGWGKGFRRERHDIPTHSEIEKLWAEDKAEMGHEVNISPGGGRFPDGEKVEVKLSMFAGDADIRYSIDGGAPGPASPLYSEPIVLADSRALKAAAFKNGKRAGSVSSVSFVFMRPREPDGPTEAAGKYASGLWYAYYHGTWDRLPDFEKLAPQKTGTTEGFDIGLRSRDDNFGFVFTGFIQVEEEGEYRFFTRSDDGSRLWIGDVKVVENDRPPRPRGEERLDPAQARQARRQGHLLREGQRGGPGCPLPGPGRAQMRRSGVGALAPGLRSRSGCFGAVGPVRLSAVPSTAQQGTCRCAP